MVYLGGALLGGSLLSEASKMVKHKLGGKKVSREERNMLVKHEIEMVKKERGIHTTPEQRAKSERAKELRKAKAHQKRMIKKALSGGAVLYG